jgi:hypothetical protein
VALSNKNSEVDGGILYHKVYLSRGVAHTMLGTVILMYRCTLFQPLYTCTHGQLIPLHSTATWRHPGLRFVNETSQGFTRQTDTKHQKRVIEVGIPPPKNIRIPPPQKIRDPTSPHYDIFGRTKVVLGFRNFGYDF